jgi:hypothetical protein
MPGISPDAEAWGFCLFTHKSLLQLKRQVRVSEEPLRNTMTSPGGAESRAEAYPQFRFEFPGKNLSGKMATVAGGVGDLVAASVSLVEAEGARRVVR